MVFLHFWDALLSSFQTIFNHKFRSFLTLLGIIIGVTSVVTMFSSVNGLKMLIDEKMSGMGWDNTLVVSAGDGNRSRFGRGFGLMRGYRTASRRSKPLTYTDYEVLKQEVDYQYLYGLVENWYMTPDNEWNRIKAVDRDYFTAQTFPLKEGRFFNHFEMSRAAKVAIVGPTFAVTYNQGENPLDQIFSFGQHRYRVIGILDEDPLNANAILNMNTWERRWNLQAVYIPLKTGATYYRTNMAIDYISFQASNWEKVNHMKNQITQTLLSQKNMERDFNFQDVGAQVLQFKSEFDSMMKKWSITLLAIATIALVVGGIGLFSTLLISINERMTEIGIRKSVGARDFDIFFYFITEALSLSFMAAIIGIILGSFLTWGLGLAIKIPVPMSMLSVYIGFAFALVIGFLSGFYPALKAAGINPIQAIYYFD